MEQLKDLKRENKVNNAEINKILNHLKKESCHSDLNPSYLQIKFDKEQICDVVKKYL